MGTRNEQQYAIVNFDGEVMVANVYRVTAEIGFNAEKSAIVPYPFSDDDIVKYKIQRSISR